MRGRIAELAEAGGRAFAAGRAPRLVSPHAPTQVREAVEQVMADVRLPGYSAAASHMASNDLGPALRNIRCPTLVVVGADDVVTGVTESELLASLIPDSRLVIIEQAGHAAVAERPDAMAAAMLTHLKRWAR